MTGNWNALTAARQVGARRVVTFSSVNALGMFRGEGKPDYFPIDDDHPIRPPTAYGMAKRLVEELCRCFSVTTGITTICFRPPAVLGPARHARFATARAADPAAEWTPYWEYGCFIDVRDVASAVLAGLTCPDPGHLTALICADDVTSPVPVFGIVETVHAGGAVARRRTRRAGVAAGAVRSCAEGVGLGAEISLGGRGSLRR